jgi:hypothetical protein
VSELERKLAAVGRRIDYPPTPDLAGSVGARLHLRRRRRPWLRPALAAAAAVLAAAAALLAVSPGARSAVLDLLEVAGVSIERVPELPEVPVRGGLYLGTPTTLAEAQRDVGFPVLRPRLGDLERPDEVYVHFYPPGGAVALLYGSLDRPRLVVTQWRGQTVEPVFHKVAGPGTRVSRVTVDGNPGVWLEGAPHLVYTIEGNLEYPEPLYLAGNVLIWERGNRAFRLEADIDRDEAIRIAQSMR